MTRAAQRPRNVGRLAQHLTLIIAIAAMLGAALATTGTVARAARPGNPRLALARALGADRPGDVTVALDPGTGAARFVGTRPGHPLPRPAGVPRGAGPLAVATAFVHAHGRLFGLTSPGVGVSTGRVAVAPGGRSVARFTQLVDGWPVLGGELTVTLTPDARIAYVTGETVQQRQPLADPRVTTRQAERIATTVTSSAEHVPAAQLTAHAPSLAVYDPRVLGVPAAVPAPAALVYRVRVSGEPGNGAPIDELVLVDVATGAVPLHLNQAEGALSQTVCDAADDTEYYFFTCPPTDPYHSPPVVSDPAGSTDTDIHAAYVNTAATVDFYRDAAGVAVFGTADRTGGQSISSVVHACDQGLSYASCVPVQGAFMGADGPVYGDGFPQADDIVAHELAHAVVGSKVYLFGLYQSGAISESVADVLGELADQWNGLGTDDESHRWMVGEDLPASWGVLRDMADPTTAPSGVPTPRFVPQPDRMTSPLYDDASDPYVFDADDDGLIELPEDGGGVHVNSGVGNKAGYLMVDGGTFNGVAVAGLGGADPATRSAAIAKAARIYLLAVESLTSGSDYADLARALPAACDALTGVAGIGADDCATVRAAVKATEMATSPPAAPTPEAPVCDSGVPSTDRYDDMEQVDESRWSVDRVTWRYENWSTGISYATSGQGSLHALDVDAYTLGDEVDEPWPLEGSATMTRPFRVPVGKPAFLRFNHAFDFEWYPDGEGRFNDPPAVYRDGGRVGYSTDGEHWRSAKDLFDFGGYNATVTGRSDLPWIVGATFQGFGGSSHGYTSARLDLSSLAGQQVWFRFRTTNDLWVGAYGWFIDDVRFYTCGAKPSAPTGIEASPGIHRETVTWRAPSDRGTSALRSYVVTVRSGSTSLASRTVSAATHSATFTGLPGGKSLTTWVRAVNASGSGPAAYSNTLVGTVVGLSASTTHVASGHEVTLSGRLLKAGTTSGLAGRRVGLYRAAPGSSHWTWLVSTTTGDRGGYAFHRSPTSDSVFQVRYLGAVPYQGALSGRHTVRVG